MARINLLPWRAERRKRRQQEFFAMLGAAALVAALLAVLINSYYSAQIESQNARNAFLEARIVEVQKQITEIDELDRAKSRLLARKQVIEELQASRSQMVHLFDELVRTVPDGIKLTLIQQAGDQLTLEGLSQSNARVSSYMRNLEASDWTGTPDLTIIEAKGDNKALPFEFKLQVRLTSPEQKNEASADAAVAGVKP
ncbi:MAG: fimbrial protein [Lysobacterales bacterium CG17_big_fil_post_rev_8_21_14_2_50_64_11]|nr:MAG: fimbrial protein [Xanthomonadales bacterium CG17_big_fil_post_rev_8_21_14_2_50_64_11]PIX61180.1 MAG: fimbrial protein [Xanthomonadales bacterium CG_4_10_14_3_um_filter_64_11]